MCLLLLNMYLYFNYKNADEAFFKANRKNTLQLLVFSWE